MTRTNPLLLTLLALAFVVACEPTEDYASSDADDALVTYDTNTVVPPPDARLSPTALARTTFDNGTYVKVTYSGPWKRGREIFGDTTLVPYGAVWRTGANETTELTTTGDLLIAGQRVPAGTYSVFSIPQPDRWTIILNQTVGQWGSGRYDEATDLLRFDVDTMEPPKSYEAFTIAFEEADEGRHLTMAWDDVKVAIPVTTP